MSNTSTRKKISVNLQPNVEKMLDQIADVHGLKQTEVIQEAIKLMSFVTNETKNNRELYTVDQDGKDPVRLVIL